MAVAVSAEPSRAATPVDEVAARRETLRRFEKGLVDLPPALRECFVLCQLEGVPGPEAARALGIRVGTLYRRIHDAKQRLRAAVGEGQ